MVEPFKGSRVVIDELIAVVGRACIEAILMLSAQVIAGEKQTGCAGGEMVRWRFVGLQRLLLLPRRALNGLVVIGTFGC